MLKYIGVVVVLCVGCITTSFIQTDPSYVPTDRQKKPRVFLDRLPEEPYHSVGIIEAMAPAGSRFEKILAIVQKKGQELGCWGLVERSIFPIRGSKPPAQETPMSRTNSDMVELAQSYRAPAPIQPPVFAAVPAPGLHYFICIRAD